MYHRDTEAGAVVSGLWTDISKQAHTVILLILHILMPFPALPYSLQSRGPVASLLCLYLIIQPGPCGI